MFQWRSPSRHDVDVINRGVENADFQRLPEERYRGTGTERRYGGFYTQADMRALIAYAAARANHHRAGDRHAWPRDGGYRQLSGAQLHGTGGVGRDVLRTAVSG